MLDFRKIYMIPHEIGAIQLGQGADKVSEEQGHKDILEALRAELKLNHPPVGDPYITVESQHRSELIDSLSQALEMIFPDTHNGDKTHPSTSTRDLIIALKRRAPLEILAKIKSLGIFKKDKSSKGVGVESDLDLELVNAISLVINHQQFDIDRPAELAPLGRSQTYPHAQLVESMFRSHLQIQKTVSEPLTRQKAIDLTISHGIALEHLPRIVSKEFDLKIYDLIKRLITYDTTYEGGQSYIFLHRALMYVFLHCEELSAFITNSINQRPNKDLSKYSPSLFKKYFHKLSYLAGDYLLAYQTSIHLDTTGEAKENEQTYVNTVEKRTIYHSIELIHMQKRIQSIDQLDQYIQQERQAGAVPKLYFAPDGSIFPNDLPEHAKGGSFLRVYIKHCDEPIIIHFPFDFTTEKLDYKKVLEALSVIEVSTIETIVVNIDHHTPYTYKIPNTSGQVAQFIPRLLQYLSDQGYLDPNDRLKILLEGLRFADDDYGLSTLLFGLIHNEWKKNSSADDYQIGEFLNQRDIIKLIRIETITDIAMGCLSPHLPEYGKDGILDFSSEEFGGIPKEVVRYLNQKFYSDVEDWPQEHRRVASSLLGTIIIKERVFTAFYQKISGNYEFESLSDLVVEFQSIVDKMNQIKSQGIATWYRNQIQSIVQEYGSLGDYLCKRIDMRYTSRTIKVSYSDYTKGQHSYYSMGLIDAHKCGPEAMLGIMLRQIAHSANSGTSLDTVSLLPVITYNTPRDDTEQEDGLRVTSLTKKIPSITEHDSIESKVERLGVATSVLVANRLFSLIRARGTTLVFRPIISPRAGTREEGTLITFEEAEWFFDKFFKQSVRILHQLRRDSQRFIETGEERYEKAHYIFQELMGLTHACDSQSQEKLTGMLSQIANQTIINVIRFSRTNDFNYAFLIRMLRFHKNNSVAAQVDNA